MRPRTLAILAAIVAGLAAFIWLVERDLPSSEERAERAKRVLRIDAEAVDRLVIERGGEVVELAREPQGPVSDASDEEAAAADRGWQLEQPLRARADASAVDGLVSRLVELEKERTLAEVSRDDVGLAAPRGRVTLSTSDGDTVLEIGSEIPASSNMTLGVEGLAEVFVVSGSIWDTLTKPAGDWRDKRLFVGERSDIERITLHSAERPVELARRGEDFWIERPFEDLAAGPAVSSLVDAISGLRAESFVDDPVDGSTSGLDPALVVIEVAVAGREGRVRLEVGLPISAEEGADLEASDVPPSPPSRYLRLDGQVVTTTAALDEHLVRAPAAWRSLDWVASEAFEVEHLSVTDDRGEVELRREGGDWLRDGERIVYGPATELLSALTGAEALRVVDTDVQSLGASEVTVRLETEDGTSETAWLYTVGEEGAVARVSGRDVALLLSSEAADEVSSSIEAVRAADLEQIDPEDA